MRMGAIPVSYTHLSCGARLAPFDIQELREITMYDELELDTLGAVSYTHLEMPCA